MLVSYELVCYGKYVNVRGLNKANTNLKNEKYSENNMLRYFPLTLTTQCRQVSSYKQVKILFLSYQAI